MTDLPVAARDPAHLLQQAIAQWGGQDDLWVFGYASLIWRPEFEFTERRAAHAHGWHRALQMWSRINRGTPERPGLVFALISGGSCHGVVFKIAQAHAHAALQQLWQREMPTGVYDARWLDCATAQGKVRALGFTLPRSSPSYCGTLEPARYADIFAHAVGRYGSTQDYALQTYHGLLHEGIEDRALHQILHSAGLDMAPLTAKRPRKAKITLQGL